VTQDPEQARDPRRHSYFSSNLYLQGLLLVPDVRDSSIGAAEGIAAQVRANRGQSKDGNDV
jgi:hypothetical protein